MQIFLFFIVSNAAGGATKMHWDAQPKCNIKNTIILLLATRLGGSKNYGAASFVSSLGVLFAIVAPIVWV